MQTTPADTGTPQRQTNGGGRSVLAADLRIKGDVTSQGTLEVMGEIEGTLTAQNLIVGAEGRVKGAVSAETVEIRGRTEGKISCAALILRAAASVKADVSYTTLIIESGAQIEGRFSRPKG
ncbi:MAG: polymer-forming cytoskeletal protein [Paracoccaceae bacterium]|nr:polymer-forming cytoskeletal protein [Paracoccaceae bacterium]